MTGPFRCTAFSDWVFFNFQRSGHFVGIPKKKNPGTARSCPGIALPGLSEKSVVRHWPFIGAILI